MKFRLIVNWIVFSLFALLVLVSLASKGILSALFILAAALLFFPPLSEFVKKIMPKKPVVAALAKTGLAVTLFIAMAIAFPNMEKDKPGNANQVSQVATESKNADAPQPAQTPIPELSGSKIVIYVKVYSKPDGNTWDSKSEEDPEGKADPIVSIKTGKKWIELLKLKNKEILTAKASVDLKDGDQIEVRIQQDGLIRGLIGEKSGSFKENEPVLIVAGRSVVQILPKELEATFTFSDFSSLADQKFDEDFESLSKEMLAKANEECAKKDWDNCKRSAGWFDENVPRLDATKGNYQSYLAQAQKLAAEAKTQQEKEERLAAQKQEKEEQLANRKRLAKRSFVNVSPDSLFDSMLLNPNANETWDKRYSARYVRWRAKFVKTGLLSKIVVNAGDSIEAVCSSFDDSYDGKSLDGLKKWDLVTLEGQLLSFEKKSGDMRANVKLGQCIVKTR